MPEIWRAPMRRGHTSAHHRDGECPGEARKPLRSAGSYRSPIFLRNEVKRLFAVVTAWEEALKALQEKKEPLLSALGGAEANFQNATARREKLAADYKAQSDALDEKARGPALRTAMTARSGYARVKEEERMEKSISDYETELKATEKTIAE